jgi:hypothetical protein
MEPMNLNDIQSIINIFVLSFIVEYFKITYDFSFYGGPGEWRANANSVGRPLVIISITLFIISTFAFELLHGRKMFSMQIERYQSQDES